MTVPPFQIPVLERRGPWGFALLFGLLGLLITLALTQYFSKDPYDSLLRRIVMQQDLSEELGVGAAPAGEALKELEAKKSAGAYYLVFWVAAQHELGNDIDPADLSQLKRSPNVEHGAVARAFGPEPLSRGQAESIRTTLEDRQIFAYDLAIRRALEKSGQLKVEPTGTPNKNLKAAVGLMMLGAVLGGFALLIAYIIARATGRLTPLGSPAGSLSAADADRYAMRAGQLILFFFFPQLLLVPLLGAENADVFELALMLLLVASAVLAPLVPIGGKRLTLRRLGISTERLGSNVTLACALAMANLPIIMGLSFVSSFLFRSLPPPEHPIQFDLENSSGPGTIAMALFLASVIAPIWEEIVFRGLILPATASLLRSAVGGVFLSSFVFAAIHPQGIPAWPMLMMIGAMAAMLTYQTRSLVPSIVMHATHNFLIVLVNVVIF